MSKTVLLPLAEGFEEIEAVAIIDILRRAGVDVTVAAVDGRMVRGGHGILVKADTLLGDCLEDDYDMVVLPGGVPGAQNLAASKDLESIVMRQYEAGKGIGAICAAPAVVLGAFGALPKGKMACYPSFASRLEERFRSDEACVVSGNIITGAGPGAALAFSLELVKYLVGESKARELGQAMLIH